MGGSLVVCRKGVRTGSCRISGKNQYEQKPYRRSIMQTFGAQVTPSPSMSTRAGKNILTKYPNHQGSLGTAISEAIELARIHTKL